MEAPANQTPAPTTRETTAAQALPTAASTCSTKVSKEKLGWRWFLTRKSPFRRLPRQTIQCTSRRLSRLCRAGSEPGQVPLHVHWQRRRDGAVHLQLSGRRRGPLRLLRLSQLQKGLQLLRDSFDEEQRQVFYLLQRMSLLCCKTASC